MSQSTWPKKIIAYTDGASRGNPGPASIGVLITDELGNALAELSEKLGIQTNNFAEYSAVLFALKKAYSEKVNELIIRADSQLMVRQMSGEYKVKSDSIRGLYQECSSLVLKFKSVKFEHIPREENQEADRLANSALDN